MYHPRKAVQKRLQFGAQSDPMIPSLVAIAIADRNHLMVWIVI